MRILSMTATFGKLEHQTLTLDPGLNVIHGHNEWGKSTWCAFLTAMLYGLESQGRTTDTKLSEKDRYTPWSGAPMSGTLRLYWQGKDITIQRSSTKRAPLSLFRAFETDSGLPVPELNAANCGQTLLGVEKSVFLRSAFIRQSDLPVTQDTALRARLNALVTTGDESDTAQRLEKKLKDLRNRCQYKRSGLLPQAEAEAAQLSDKLAELDRLDAQIQGLIPQQKQANAYLAELKNHQIMLTREKRRQEADQIQRAQRDLDRAETELARLQRICGELIPEKEANTALLLLDELQGQLETLLQAEQQLPAVPAQDAPAPFQGMALAEAQKMLEADWKATRIHRAPWFLLPLPGLLAWIGTLLWLPQFPWAGWLTVGLTLSLTVAGIVLQLHHQKAARALAQKYGTGDPLQWRSQFDAYTEVQTQYQRRQVQLSARKAELEALQTAVQGKISQLCDGRPPQECRRNWLQALQYWEDRKRAWDEREQTRRHRDALVSMAQKGPLPELTGPDRLNLNAYHTESEIAATTQKLQQLHNKLGQYQGRMDAVGQRSTLENQLAACRRRIQALRDTYEALTLALETLEQARSDLQRRFAPKITQRAQTLMQQFTEGRYDRLRLTEELSLQAAAAQEDFLRPALWRSDGTTDQLYLALRLAVAGELIPQAPLVLDDALVRFDDRRLAAAMTVLHEEAKTRQILLFTCQQRELQYK